MTTGIDGGNSNESTTGAQASLPGAGTGGVIAAAQRLLESFSNFAQEDNAYQERFLALIQNSGGEANAKTPDAQTAPGESIAEQARDAAQQLQESLSGFFQEDQRGNENLSRSMDRPSDELGELKREIKDNRRETDRLRDLIRNYRNW